MRILLFCNELPPRRHGGIGTFCVEFSRALRAAGHAVIFLEVGAVPDNRYIADIPVICIPEPRTTRARALRSRLRLGFALPSICRAHSPHIMEVPDFGGWVPFTPPPIPLVARLHGTSTLIAPHNGGAVRQSVRFFERRTLQLSSRWIAPTHFILQATAREFRLVPPASTVIYNPLPSPPDDCPLPAARPNAPFLLYAGWINRAKGALALGQALPLVFEQRPDVHAVFLGKDVASGGRSTKSIIRHLVGGDNLHRIHFPGHVTRAEVLGWMGQAAVFVLPSHFESLGLVYLEALRAGLPVIASNRSGEPELFATFEGITLVHPDDPTQIAQAILRVLRQQQEARAAVARDQQILSSTFSIERCVEESLRLYDHALCSPGGRQ